MTTTDTSPAGEWAKVELMGHRTRCGMVQEVDRFGTKLLRIDLFQTDADAPLLTEYYSGSAIFSFTPCTESLARRWADNRWNLPDEARLALPSPAAPEAQDAELVEDDDDDIGF